MKSIIYRGYRITHFIGTNEWCVETMSRQHIKICDTKRQAMAYIDGHR